MPEIHIIAAVARQGALGRGGSLLFHLPADLRHFKELTMGCPIIMGRKTFESFPRGPLPGRLNIVVTRNPAYSRPGITVASSLPRALELCGAAERAYVLGGGEIYAQAMPLASVIDLTEIDADAPGADTFFPEIPAGEFRRVECGEWLGESPKFRFVTLTRSSNVNKM